MNQPFCSAILLAAGKGTRMGTDVKKQFLLLEGKEIVAYTVDAFEGCTLISEIVLVCSKDGKEQIEKMRQRYGWTKVSAVLEGGAERQDSVTCGLRAVATRSEVVLIHDGVRPFVDNAMIEKSIAVAMESGACVVGMPAKDTIKVCDGDGFVLHTPKRSGVWHAQTPQTFRKEVLMQAFEKANEDGFLGTDDASLVEYIGGRVRMIEGSYRNIKITTKEDLDLAATFLKGEIE